MPETFDKFRNLKPSTDSFGQSIVIVGESSVVFKMHDSATQKEFALKCFLKYQNKRKEYFDTVSDYLEDMDSSYLCNYEYVEDEMSINGSTYPVLLMDWIEGVTMSLYIAKLCRVRDRETLSLLAGKFDTLGLWLINRGLAHCDINPDNILVTPQGDLKLVDYDGMYVPELRGKCSLDLGVEEYRHPKRTNKDFGPQLDDFSILVLSLSLHCLAKDPTLYDSTSNSRALLFEVEDYASLLSCRHLPFFIENQKDEVISSRFGLLLHALSQLIICLKSLPSVLTDTAHQLVLTTTAKSDDGVWFDEFGVKYSEDRRKLIECSRSYDGEYVIREGVVVICDSAFKNCSNLSNIVLPNSLEIIGNHAFSRCKSLSSIVLPKNLKTIESRVFDGCCKLENFITQDGHFRFDNGALYDLVKKEIVILLPSLNKESFVVPSGILSIGYGAFYECKSLSHIVLPDSLINIEGVAFDGCNKLLKLDLPVGITKIEYGTFKDCNSLSSLDIPNGVMSIGESAFEGCSSLTSLVLPDSVRCIDSNAFYECKSLFDIVLPPVVDSLGDCVFECCSNLTHIVLPAGIKEVEYGLFGGCSNLTHLVFQEGLTSFDGLGFCDCSELSHIVFAEGLTTIEEEAFWGFYNLESLSLPMSVTMIGEDAFKECDSLRQVIIPKGAHQLRTLLVENDIDESIIVEE